MSGALTTAAIVGGVGSLAGGAISSSAAGNAASAQANAATQAAQLQYQASQNALDFQKQQWNTTQQNQQPWLQSGTGALSNLDYLMGISPQSPSSYAMPGTNGTANAGGSNGLQLSAQPTGGPVQPNSGNLPVANPAQATSGARQAVPGAQGATFQTNPGTPGVSSNAVQGVPQMGSTTGLPGNTATGTPSLTTGTGGFSTTPTSSASGGYGSLMAPWTGTFTSPDAITEQNDPGYQARMKLGTDAIQRSAAAAGGVVTGGTAQALDQYGQDYASNEYNNVYNRAYQNYATGYNQFEQDQANQFNRLAAISGVGQTAANQLATSGQAASNNVSSNLLNTAQNMGTSYQNAAAANASGIVGGANAWNSALSGAGSSLSQLSMLQQLFGGTSSGGYGNSGGAGYSYNPYQPQD